MMVHGVTAPCLITTNEAYLMNEQDWDDKEKLIAESYIITTWMLEEFGIWDKLTKLQEQKMLKHLDNLTFGRMDHIDVLPIGHDKD